MPIVCRGGVERFPGEYVYFGFYSILGCTFQMEAQFTEPIFNKVGAKKTKGKNLDDMDEEDMDVIKDYARWKEKHESFSCMNFMEENKNFHNYSM